MVRSSYNGGCLDLMGKSSLQTKTKIGGEKKRDKYKMSLSILRKNCDSDIDP